MATNYELPQVRVFQDLEANIEPSERAMLPVIIGTLKDIVRYDYLETDEDIKALGLLGTYSGAEAAYVWPTLGANSEADINTARVFGENVMVGLQSNKVPFIGDTKILSPIHSSFDPTAYFVPLADNQLNAIVFSDDVDNDGINLSGSSLLRPPAVGDYIKILHTSDDTDQNVPADDWASKVTGLVHTIATRVNEGVGTVVDDDSNLMDDTAGASTLAVGTSIPGGTHLGLEYKVIDLNTLATLDGTNYGSYTESVANKACANGLFSVEDMGFSVRIAGVTDTEITVVISSRVYNKVETVALEQFIYNSADTTRVWCTGSGFNGADRASAPLGGIVVDDMFVIFAKAFSAWAAVAADRKAGDYVTHSDNNTYQCQIDHSTTSGSVFSTDLAAGKWALVGVTANLNKDPVKNDTFSLIGTLKNMRQYYNNPDATVWADETVYVEGCSVSNTVDVTTTVYRCLETHTSAALFSTDLAAGKWVVAATDDCIPEVVDGSVFDSTSDTVYRVEVLYGGAVAVGSASAPNIQLRVTSNTNLDASAIRRVAVDSLGNFEVPVGTKGITLKFYATGGYTALAKGDFWTIDCTGRAADKIVGVITEDSFLLPGVGTTLYRNVASQSVDFELLQNIPTVNVPKVQTFGLDNWTVDADGISMEAEAAIFLASVNSDVVISAADLYASYTATNSTYGGTVLTVDTDSDARIGEDDPLNPLGYGVRKARANSQGLPVLAAPVSDFAVDLDSVLEVLSTNNNAYQLVPLTFDASAQDDVLIHAVSMSHYLMDRWRVVYVSTDVKSEYPVAGTIEDGLGEAVLASFKEGPSGLYNKLTIAASSVSEGANFNGVKAGNMVRFDYGVDMYGDQTYREFVVLSTDTSNTVYVLGDYGPNSDDAKIEVYRDTTADDVIEAVGGRSLGLNSRRVTNVFPPYAEDSNGVVVPGYFVAAALAGRAAGVDPHQGLTNSKLIGFSNVNTLAPMSRMGITKLNDLAATGVTILTGSNFNIGIRHELTTCMLDRKNREAMVTRNLDSLSYQYFDAVSPFIGIANVTPEFLEKLRTELKSVSGYIISVSKRPLIGSQMISCDITKIEQDPVLSDKINMYLRPVLPFPFNYGDIHLQI